VDKVIIEGLEAWTTIGIYDWEKQIKQKLILDLELGTDIKKAADNDDIQYTLDYKAISHRIHEVIEVNRFELVETVAERVANLIMDEFDVPWLKLKVLKPGAVSIARNVGVIIERSRQ